MSSSCAVIHKRARAQREPERTYKASKSRRKRPSKTMLAVEKLLECAERMSIAFRRSLMRSASAGSGVQSRIGRNSDAAGKTDEDRFSYERMSWTARQ